MKNDFLISVVVPVYKEEGNIVPFLERCIKVMEENDYRLCTCISPHRLRRAVRIFC